jgi:DNA invertase Pin-like site-specific DNA recombinase
MKHDGQLAELCRLVDERKRVVIQVRGYPVMRAAIYARYSSERQSEASVEDQVRICKERISREGWQLVEVFQDRAISGATAFRPGYQAVLAAGRNHGFDVVVMEATHRLQAEVRLVRQRARRRRGKTRPNHSEA